MAEKKQDKQKIWNVPNALTMLRMVMIPIYWYLMMNDRYYWALGVYVVAALTDIADGKIARKYNLITDFGKLFDPLADKLMVISVMLTMVLKGILPILPLIIIAAKECLMVFGGLVMLKKGIVVYAIWIGKAAQATIVSALILSFFYQFLEQYPVLGMPVNQLILWIGVGLTLAALVMYGTNAVKQVKAKEQQEKA